MPFCTQCGHKNTDDSRFCDECGTPLKVAAAAVSNPTLTAATAPAPATATEPASAFASTPAPATGPATAAVGVPRKPLRIKTAAMVAAGLVVVGAGGYFLLAPETPSNERFAAAIEKSLAADSTAYKPRFCLSNFPYERDTVHVNDQDIGTQRWLSVLSRAGLYAGPELIEDTSGYFVRRQLKYTKTDAGKKATQGGQLCVADGVTVGKVDSFTPPSKVGEIEASRATVTLKLRNPMPWVAEEETQSTTPGLKVEFAENIVMVLKDGKWVVADNHTVQEAVKAERKAMAAKQSAASGGSSEGGFMASVKKLFSFAAGNPVIGKWKAQVMGNTMDAFEFTSDAMITGGQKVKVRYEVEDKRVTIYSEGAGAGLIIDVIDHDTLSMDMGLTRFKLIRSDK